MSEKMTLGQLGKASEDLYGQYKANHYEKARAERSLEHPPVVEGVRVPFERKKTYEARVAEVVGSIAIENQKTLERTTTVEDANLVKAKTFADENAGDLHDLALVQAHLDGVSVDTESPIQVGQKVSAPTPEQHEAEK